MSDQRRYIGVRISEQGHGYIKLVAQRDRINYSEALRRLLALGARTDMEAHSDTTGRPRSSDGTADQRETGAAGAGDTGDADRHGGEDPRVPEPATGSPLGDAIRTLYNAGLNPQTVQNDSPGAA